MSIEEKIVGETSTGHELSNAAFIDTHFQASQQSYEQTIRAAGFQKGWHVLDAGAGSGSFLSLLADILGEQGRIIAYDLAPENIEIIERLKSNLAIPVETKVGDVCSLPFEDNSFDGIWSANVTQYMTDEQAAQSFKECLRVLKPGGVFAIKEIDMTGAMTYPFNSFTMWRLLSALEQDAELHQQISLIYRALALPSFLRNAGFVQVSQQSFVQEWTYPLTDSARELLGGYYQWLAMKAENLPLSAEDKIEIEALKNSTAKDGLLNDPNFYAREFNLLFLGYKAQ